MLYALGLMAGSVIVAAFVLAAMGGVFESFPYFFLLPWIIGLGVVMAIPSAVLYHRGEFSLGHPIVFATIGYFGPAFVLGGALLAMGYSEPYYLSYIQDARSDLPFTVVIIGLGFASLSAGFFLPIGSRPGNWIRNLLPEADYPAPAFVLPGVILLVLGVANTIFAFTIGLFGYQFSSESNTYAGLIYLSTLFRVQASFLLWLVIFRQPKLNFVSMMLIAGLMVIDLGTALFAGNRGMIVTVIIMIVLAFVFSGRKFKLRHGVAVTAVMIVGLVVGMIYGSTFRMVKGTEAQQSTAEYTDNIFRTFDEVGRSGAYDNLALGMANLSERLDIVSTLAVVVSNHEKLKPYEEAYGLDDNIWVDTTTFFIPRVIWVEKPAASDARKYSDLYFNVSDSSFAITPMGDLLRNYGLIGVPIGMFILGVILRFIYSALIGPGNAPIWRITLYFMLLTAVSYEGFYGTIVPSVAKVGFTAALGTLLVVLIARKVQVRNRTI